MTAIARLHDTRRRLAERTYADRIAVIVAQLRAMRATS